MRIQTKYGLGDQVVNIWPKAGFKTLPCPQCAGTPPRFADGKPAYCHHCRGVGELRKEVRQEWVVVRHLTIGMVRAEREMGKATETSYMALETGVGSGQIYREDNLFPTVADAEAECAKRNEGIKWEKF